MPSNDQSQAPQWLGRLAPLLPLLPAFGIFTGLVVFLGRLYLESYYSFFGIPPSSLDLDIQDYTFGSFPVVVFVLIVTAAVFLYALQSSPGWLGRRLGKFIGSSIAGFRWGFANIFTPALLAHALASRIRSESRFKEEAPTDDFIRQVRFYLGMVVFVIARIVISIIAYVLLIMLVLVLLSFLALTGLAISSVTLSVLGIGVGFELAVRAVTNVFGAEGVPDFLIDGWDLWNVPGLRGLTQGALLAVGALVLVSFVEWTSSEFKSAVQILGRWNRSLVRKVREAARAVLDNGVEAECEGALAPAVAAQNVCRADTPTSEDRTTEHDPGEAVEAPRDVAKSDGQGEASDAKDGQTDIPNSDESPGSGGRSWLPLAILLAAVFSTMPVATHFMARDQAMADLTTRSNRFESSLPVAVFNSASPLGEGHGWPENPENCGTNNEQACKTPELKVVLMNNDTAYVLLEEDVENEAALSMYTVAMKDVSSVTYVAPVGSFVATSTATPTPDTSTAP